MSAPQTTWCWITLLCLCFSLLVNAQHATPAPANKQATEAYKALQKTAAALGMIRGMQRTWRSINRIYYIAAGKIDDQNVTQVRIEMSYTQNAVRTDINSRTAEGTIERRISVVRGDTAWTETTPGLGHHPAPETAARQTMQLYTTPHGAIRAAIDTEVSQNGSVTVTNADSFTQFEFILGSDRIRIQVNAENLPTEITIDNKNIELTTQLADYRDWELLDVLFPATIVQTVQGKEARNLIVSEFRSNPYVVFPLLDAQAKRH